MTPEIDFTLSPVENALIEFTNCLYDPTVLETIAIEEIRDVLSSGQILSKKWLLNEFALILKKSTNKDIKVMIAGGWLGILACALDYLDEKLVVDTCDTDPRAARIAHLVLKYSRGQSFNIDMYKVKYADYDCVINTSTEHITDIRAWSDLIPTGKWVVAQGNNQKAIKDHISCVESADELAEKLHLNEIHFTGKLVFPFYTRYMVIGKK